MNSFQSINSIFAIILNHLWLFISLLVHLRKIQLISNSRNLTLKFSPDLLEKMFWCLEHFVENEKRWKSFGARFGEYGVEQTYLNLIFSPVWLLLNVTLYHHGGAQCFSYQWEAFLAHIAAVEGLSLHWVSDCRLKTQNELFCDNSIIHIVKLFFHEALPLGLAVDIHHCQSPFPFALNIIIKNLFFCHL